MSGGSPAVKSTNLLALRYCGFAFIVTLLGCAATSHVITDQPREPHDPAQVTLYTTAPPNYEQIGIIEA